MRDEPIDVEVKVTPLEGTVANPYASWLAVKRQTRQGVFDPPTNPEMRGRRPSGKVFKAEDVPKEARGIPIAVQAPEEPKITKRSCKSVAEELTRRPVQVREISSGRCEIEVVFPLERLVFTGTTWFLALLSLKQHLDGRKLV